MLLAGRAWLARGEFACRHAIARASVGGEISHLP
jgi:hypothetical protein